MPRKIDALPRLFPGPLLVMLWIALLASLSAPSPVGAQKAVEWARFDVNLELRPDGSYHVQERQQIDFEGGPFHRGFRDIPLQRIEGIQNVQVSEVTDGRTIPYEPVAWDAWSEAPQTYSGDSTSTNLHIEWGFDDTVSSSRTFLIEYDVLGALRSYLDANPPNQQIWWIAVGKDLTAVAPVRESTVTITLPAAVDQSKVLLDADAKGNPAEHTKDGKVWTWLKNNLTDGDSFEVRLQFPPLVNAPPPAWQQNDDGQRRRQEQADGRGALLNAIFLGIGLLTGAGGLVGLYGLWYAKGRDPHTGPVADFLPQPPDDLPPGAAGTLLDERADERDVVATLVDLGKRGVIKIDELADAGFLGFGGSRDFNLTLLQSNVKVAPFEAALLSSLFGSKLTDGATTKLSDVKQGFVAAQATIKDKLYDELVTRKYFARSPETTRSNWKRFGLIALIVVIVAAFALAGAVAASAPFFWLPVIVVAGLALLIVLLSRAMPRKTTEGAEAAAKWRAFRKYLDSIEQYENLGEAKGIFDRYLAYAVAFGLEQSWVQKFASVQTPTPAWYGGGVGGGYGGGFDMEPAMGRRRRRGFGGPIMLPTGGWDTGGGGNRSSGSDWDDGRSGGDGGGGFDLPDLQGTSDSAGRSLQSSSNGLFDMLNSASKVFGGFSGGGHGGGGGWGGGGGGGFGGGGSSGGGSGGGGGGFS